MAPDDRRPNKYRGRLAPTPSGYLHLGHARTFWVAWSRAREAGGALLLRMEDIDPDRCRPAYAEACLEDLRWLGLDWDEGPDRGGRAAPYTQSERLPLFLDTWRRLRDAGAIYPSPHSRKEVERARESASESEGESESESARGGGSESESESDANPGADGPVEPIFPLSLRAPPGTGRGAEEPGAVNWRFRVPDGEAVSFRDGAAGEVTFAAGRDFGDFLVWRKDGMPAYEMAVVADDHAMEITEVVRGEDLLLSTARQILLFRSLGWEPPAFHHCPLVRDNEGRRLAKRDGDRGLRHLRAAGLQPEDIRAWFGGREVEGLPAPPQA